MQRIAVIGAGAWGTALAEMLAAGGRDVRLWCRRPALAERITAGRENADYLAGLRLSANLTATAAAADLGDAELVLMVTPAQALGEVAAALAPHLPPAAPVLICAKGIERESLRLMSEVAEAVLPGRPLAVLSGPTFATEVARGLPTAVTLAAGDAALGRRLVAAIGGARFRPYLSDDPVGAEIGGAVKNVLAIACGIVIGRRLGDNARAALVTRSLAEMIRLAVARGGRAETLMGLSGLGDLTLTCNGIQSRNLSIGIALGEGRRLAELVAERRSVAEGVFSAAAVVALAGRLGVDMPIAAAVDAILNRGGDIDETIAGLLARPFRDETSPRAGALDRGTPIG